MRGLEIGGADEVLILTYFATTIFLIWAAWREKAPVELSKSGRRFFKVKRWLLAILLWVILTGWLFKSLHFPGADEQLIVGLGKLANGIWILAIINALHKRPWNLLPGFLAVPVVVVGIMFIILEFPGSDEMLYLGVIISGISILVLVWEKEIYTPFMRKILLTATFFGIMFLYFPTLSKALLYLEPNINVISQKKKSARLKEQEYRQRREIDQMKK